MVNILPHNREEVWCYIYKNRFTLAATLDTDIHHSKHCINLALPTLVPVLNSPVLALTVDVLFYAVGLFMLIVFAILIAIIQPYKAGFAIYNIVDTVFVLILALWYRAVLCLNLASLKDYRYTTTSKVAMAVVAVLPLFYITAITLHWVCSRTMIGRNLIRKIRGWVQHQPLQQLQDVNGDDFLPHRLSNPEQYSSSLEDPVAASLMDNSSCSSNNSSDNETTY